MRLTTASQWLLLVIFLCCYVIVLRDGLRSYARVPPGTSLWRSYSEAASSDGVLVFGLRDPGAGQHRAQSVDTAGENGRSMKKQQQPDGPVTAADVAARAWRSGSAGFTAGVCQVLAFMWLRTTMNYQYKYGGSFLEALATLRKDGGIARLYRGLFPWALLQAPLSRFGDTAANDATLAAMAAWFPCLPLGFVTLVGSCVGALWRIVITPVDTCKTALQTDGEKGWYLIQQKVTAGGVTVLWYGWEANWLANVVGNYPWFITVNFLSSLWEKPAGFWTPLLRHAVIGAVASTVSDLMSNSLRVVKTNKQTLQDPKIGYRDIVLSVLHSDGAWGLFMRGMETRILANVLQGALFTVIWKGLSSST
eukprot:TRINITY_DN15181_c0_g1_i7.p1 TRINITY_DN15181_c0_g1~~TRINITY_DN15181_c0_g1_i7.p1  ORF type:complete len:364 (-),score=55.34 TRINITY_DN15181_c0_g1_i7:130-1221(-)